MWGCTLKCAHLNEIIWHCFVCFQGKSIQDEPCDTGIPCPPTPGRRQSPPTVHTGVGRKGNEKTGSVSSPGEIGEHLGRHGGNRKYTSRPSFMDFSVLNVSTTPGCECGCILYDLVPTKNYSLVIIISANQSSCADEDEEDHHNFRWILHVSKWPYVNTYVYALLI